MLTARLSKKNRFLLIVLIAVILAVPAKAQDRKDEPKAANKAAIMSFQEYVKINHPVPYILRVSVGKGDLLYFGSRHTFDPEDPQVAQIEKLWQEVHPDIAFFEGGHPEDKKPLVIKDKTEIGRYGEPSLVVFLATRDNVTVRTLEPARTDEIKFLLKHYTVEQVKLFYVLRQIPQFRKSQQSESIESMVGNMLGGLSLMPSLKDAPRNLKEFEASYSRLFPNRPNWREAPQSWVDPAPPKPEAYTNELSAKLSYFRDQHMVELLLDQMNQGRRVFAVVGSSHVVMQEPALRARSEKRKR